MAVSSKRQKGFSLVEVLVSVLVLSVGLLGLAGLQGTVLRSTHSAYLRSQAAILAGDMVDRMRANPAGEYGGYKTSPSSVEVNDDFGGQGTADSVVVGCSPQQLAGYDKARWSSEIARVLPRGVGEISSATDRITLSWLDSHGRESLSVPVSL
ncbi:MAG: type IV pilus modification protein PilV [Sedimenticola sp.]